MCAAISLIQTNAIVVYVYYVYYVGIPNVNVVTRKFAYNTV